MQKRLVGVGLLVAAGLVLGALTLVFRSDRQADEKPPSGPPDAVLFVTSAGKGSLEDLARRATVVDRERSQEPVLQVDTGDFLGDVADSTGARAILQAYTRMGVDAVTVGEKELALGPTVFADLARSQGLPVVAANVTGPHGELLFPASESVSVGGSRIGIFGIFELPQNDVPTWSSRGVAWTDAVRAVRDTVKELRGSGSRIIVGLFHVSGGAARAQQIAAQAGVVIDILAVGAAADTEASASRHDGSLIVQSGGDGTGMGRVALFLSGSEHVFDGRFLQASDAPEQLGIALLLRVPGMAPATRVPFDGGYPDLLSRHERWTYASTEACAFCHTPEVNQWRGTAHAHALASLHEAGRDNDPACLGCHMTGFLEPGGTVYLDTAISEFPDVGCEECHGPSSAHVGSADKKKGTSQAVAPTLCYGCHTPDQSVEPFDLKTAWAKIVGPGHGDHAPPPP
jgi:hypothetical protein